MKNLLLALIALTFSTSVFASSNKIEATFDQDNLIALEEVISIVQSSEVAEVTIISSTVSSNQNQNLAQAKATAQDAFSYLLSQGVDINRITFKVDTGNNEGAVRISCERR
jgi:hypothetical protein